MDNPNAEDPTYTFSPTDVTNGSVTFILKGKKFGCTDAVSMMTITIRKNTIAKQIQEPELKEIPIEKQVDPFSRIPDETTQTENYLYEEELIRILLRFGTREIIISEQNANSEDKTSIIELVLHELHQDELNFNHPLYQKIYGIFTEGIAENTLYSTSYFKKIEDQEIVGFVSDIESRDIELSHNWISQHSIFTKSESDNLYQTVMAAIYNFKYNKVDEHITKLKKSFQSGELSDEDVLIIMAEQMAFEKVKKILSDKLGRIIVK